MTTWGDVPEVSDVTISELGENLPVVSRRTGTRRLEQSAVAESASELKKALNGDWPMTRKSDVQDAEYRVGQTVFREVRQKSQVEFGQR